MSSRGDLGTESRPLSDFLFRLAALGRFPQEAGLQAWSEAAASAEWQGVSPGPGPSSQGCSTLEARERAVRSDGHGRLADRAEYQFVECAGDNHDERESGSAKQWLDRAL